MFATDTWLFLLRMGLNDSFSATKLKSEQKYLDSAYISIFCFLFHWFCSAFSMSEAKHNFVSFSSFVSCRNWSGNCSCPGAGSEWKHGPCCTSAEILLPRFAGGLMNPWRRRWCVLKNEAFMWFRTKQEALKSGWLYKKGGGMSTLSRRNWKRRWFVLRESKLMYFENDSEEKLKGTIDIRRAKWVQK